MVVENKNVLRILNDYCEFILFIQSESGSALDSDCGGIVIICVSPDMLEVSVPGGSGKRVSVSSVSGTYGR